MPSKLFLNTRIDGFAFQGRLSFLQNLSNGVECDRKVTLGAVHTFRVGVGEDDGICATVWPIMKWEVLHECLVNGLMVLSEAGGRPGSPLLTLTSSQNSCPSQPGSEAAVIFARLVVV